MPKSFRLDADLERRLEQAAARVEIGGDRSLRTGRGLTELLIHKRKAQAARRQV